MTRIDKDAPVMITGATGYVAGWIVHKLLKEGHTVHATVRNPDEQNKLEYLTRLTETLPGKLRFFKADLLEIGTYDKAMAGCQLVFHTASPFLLRIRNAQKDLIEPALLGTENVLTSANRSESVKRIVLTSSSAAIYGDNIDARKKANGVLTEEDWNTSSSLHHNPYAYSKTQAEKKAWEMVDQQSRWDLVVINPSLVIGPGISPLTRSGSYEILQQMGNGKMRAGLPLLGMSVVDVRDLADAHYQAGIKPKARGRHIVSAENSTLLDLAKMLLPVFGKDYPLPRRQVPKFIATLAAPFSGTTRAYAQRNFGYSVNLDNSKSIRELGIRYRPARESMVEFFQQLVDHGFKPKR